MNSKLQLIIVAAILLKSEAFGIVNTNIITSTTPGVSFKHIQYSPLSKGSTSLSSSPVSRLSPLYVASLGITNKNQHRDKQLSTPAVKPIVAEKKIMDNTQPKQHHQYFVETTARSAVKAMIWRIVAGSVTFITTLKFSGNVAYALQVVGSDFFSKAATMFIGERLMNKSSAGRGDGADSAGRSVAKALIWRLFAICNTLTVCFFISKDFSMASKIAGNDAIFKTFLMVAYERSWAKIEWGKEYRSCQEVEILRRLEVPKKMKQSEIRVRPTFSLNSIDN